MKLNKSIHASVPSVHRILNLPVIEELIDEHGRAVLLNAIRQAQDEIRFELSKHGREALGVVSDKAIIERIKNILTSLVFNSLRPVFNLTGIVLHSNLGRSLLPTEAIDAVIAVTSNASNLEFDIESGRRGDRDSHLETQICELTGAEAATVVNNNAAAVLLTLNSLALRREVLVSRGELIEIGGSFRMPEIMVRAGCKLKEVGTTNRTHFLDFSDGIGPRTSLILKAHTSNFKVVGFKTSVNEDKLSALAKKSGIPFVINLGSGSLIDISKFGLPHEPTAQETLKRGADLVTFSGDKLLGGPQCGIIAGRADLVSKIKKNHMKRALRVDKMTIAALSTMLRLYQDSDRATEKIPALRLLARSENDIRDQAHRIMPSVNNLLGKVLNIDIVSCQSQVGSGAMPTEGLVSAGLAFRPRTGKRGEGAFLKRLAAKFRMLPKPVIGRIHDGALIFDLRCLSDEEDFVEQLQLLLNCEGKI